MKYMKFPNTGEAPSQDCKLWWHNRGNIAQKNLEDDIFNPAKKKQAVRLAVFRPHFKKMDGGR